MVLVPLGGGALAHLPEDAVGQKAVQDAMNGRMRFAKDARQLRRVREWRLPEGI